MVQANLTREPLIFLKKIQIILKEFFICLIDPTKSNNWFCKILAT